MGLTLIPDLGEVERLFQRYFLQTFDLSEVRKTENIEMLPFYKPLTSPRSYGKKHFKAVGLHYYTTN